MNPGGQILRPNILKINLNVCLGDFRCLLYMVMKSKKLGHQVICLENLVSPLEATFSNPNFLKIDQTLNVCLGDVKALFKYG